MSEIKFNKILEFNGYEFIYYNELAEFLSGNFDYSLRMLKDNSLFDLLDEGNEFLSLELKEVTKGFKHKENVLTLIIYRLSNSSIYITNSHKFKSSFEIALEMKRTYPNINNEIMLLLQDKVLSSICYDEYNFTKDLRHKRMYEFMVHVEENSNYKYCYYYFFINHLSNNETITFIINNVEFVSIEELTSYMYTNQKNINNLLQEIKTNDFVLALIASKTNINSLTIAYKSDDSLDLLCLLNEVSNYDFTSLLEKKMSYWLLDNYHNYTYESKAKKLYEEYSLVVRKEGMSFVELFNQVKYLEELYKKFLVYYKSDKIIERTNLITALSDEYHLGYIYNNDYVSSKYLIDNELTEINIYSSEYVLAQEKEIVLRELNYELSELTLSDELLYEYYSLFNEERYKEVSFRFSIIMIFLIPIIIGGIFGFFYEISQLEKIILYVFSIPSLLLIGISLLFILPEYNILEDIKKRKKTYTKNIKKINKIKLKLATINYNEENQIDETINLDFLKENKKILKQNLRISKKEKVITEHNKTILNKITLAVSFFPAISFCNHIFFNLLNIEYKYLIVETLPILYLLFVLVNFLIIIKGKFYRNCAIFYLFSIVVTILLKFI